MDTTTIASAPFHPTFGDIQTVSLAAGLISPEGQKVINHFLRGLGIPHLPEWWEWRTRVAGKGEYVGSFPKRVAKYYYQTIAFKISSNDLGTLGQIMNEHTSRENSYRLDFTRNFDWEAGDFGDKGSCFWNCHEDAKDSILDGDGFAVRFYEEGEGIGRAWIIPLDGYHVVFNGYGLSTSDVAFILAQHWGQSYRRINLDNCGATDGLVYINGGVGFIVGPESVIHGKHFVTLQLEGGSQCCNCAGMLDEDDMCFVEGVGEMCEECFCEDYGYCDNCGEAYPSEDLTDIEDRYLCEYCRDRSYTVCDDCDDWTPDVEITEACGGDVCQSCLENYGYCEDCDEYHHLDSMISVGDKSVCVDCVSSYLCEACGETSEDTLKVHGVLACPDCVDEVEEENTPLFAGVS